MLIVLLIHWSVVLSSKCQKMAKSLISVSESSRQSVSVSEEERNYSHLRFFYLKKQLIDEQNSLGLILKLTAD